MRSNSAKGIPSMTSTTTIVVRRFFDEIWNQRREATIDELLDDESVCHTDNGEVRGPRAFRDLQYVPFITAFPDLRMTVEEVLADGDQAAVRWEAVGTHTGSGLGFPPTNQVVRMRGISWIRVAAGKMREGWQSSNVMQALAALQPSTSRVGTPPNYLA